MFCGECMRICAINNISNIGFFNRQKNIHSNNGINLISIRNCDEVSFSGKNYTSESVINPTNHCAYCGCKVYTEAQTESIAQEMLSSKSTRLQGKIRSVSEKLSEGKNAPEITVAKKIENADEIKFFDKFLESSEKKPFLKGESIFEQVYNLNRDEAQKLLVKNMHPLIKTIDHTSPQNLEQDNNNVDLNLVEACCCCNQHLKDGVTFDVFYRMFPSIKNNMPKEKFDFAMAQLLESSQENVKKRISATNILKHLERLFVEKTETVNYLNSIDYKIKSCGDDINVAIEDCENDITEKRNEILEQEGKLSELENDKEYLAILERNKLESSLNVSSMAIEELKGKRLRVSNSLNELVNGNVAKKSSKSKTNKQGENSELTEEQKQTQISDLKVQLAHINEQIQTEMLSYDEIKLELDILNEEYPTVEMYQSQKNRADKIYASYISLEKERKNRLVLNQSLEEASKKEADILFKISGYPDEDFKSEDYSAAEQADFDRYNKLREALSFIELHPNGGYVKVLINQTALIQINKEIEFLETKPVIIAFNKSRQKKQAELELTKTQGVKNDIIKQINNSDKQIHNLSVITSVMSMEEAQKKSEECSNAIRRLTDKQNLVKIPQRISTLKAEIMLLKTTIAELQVKLSKIEQMYEK